MGLWVIFVSTSALFFVAAAEDLSAKQRNVSLQQAARKLRVCYTHTNARQSCDGMCVPTTPCSTIQRLLSTQSLQKAHH